MIKIISCFWNASEYVENCINSIKSQTHKDYKVFLIDDVSNDNSVEKIRNLIDGDDRFRLIINQEKKGKLKNIDDLLLDDELFDDEDIIVELDGDDWLYNENVIEKIYKSYNEDKNLWLTNGSFIYSNGQFGFSSKVNYKTIRKDVFKFSHLRTWKCHLWRNINEESFLDDNGNYFMSAPDVAYSFPLVELAGDKHYKYIPDIMYVYNAESPYNEHKPNSFDGGVSSQLKNANTIRNKKPYRPL
jgi:glycosyltransferase involved in cell wall biosynthesis